MNRIQKKCIIASAGVHLLLALMLIFGPGFLSSRSNDNSPPVLTFVAIKTSDDEASGGGDNTVKAPPAAATTPDVAVAPLPVVTPPAQVTPPVVERIPPPQVQKTPTPTPKVSPRLDTPAKIDAPVKPPKHEIKVDTTIKTASAADVKAIRDAQAKAAAAEKQRIATALGHATAGIRGGVSGSTEVRLKGPGGGGVPYANIKSAIYSKYFDAWAVPDGAPDLTVFVSITLARDGSVVSTRITDRSGNSALDASVQKALDRVKFIAPLPDSETQETREFNFGFNPEMKSSG